MTTPEPRLPGVSTREAAMMLGTSQSDVLRRIRRGDLKAERFDRPGGTILRVLIDAPDATPPDASHSESILTPEPRQDTPRALQAAVDAALELLDSERAERQQTAAENAELRERVGRAEARAELESARATDLAARLAKAEADLDAERAEVRRLLDRISGRRWWRPSTW